MKNFLTALIVAGSLFGASTTHAEIQNFTSSYEYGVDKMFAPQSVEEQTLATKRTATGEIKIFEANAGGHGAPAPDYNEVIRSAENKVRQQMTDFVMEYCRKRNLKITHARALDAVDFSSEVKIVNSKCSIDHFYVTAQGSLYMDKLNTWIKKFLRR